MYDLDISAAIHVGNMGYDHFSICRSKQEAISDAEECGGYAVMTAWLKASINSLALLRL